MAYSISNKTAIMAAFGSYGVNSVEEVQGLMGTTVEGVNYLPIDASQASQDDANSLINVLSPGTLFRPTNHSDSSVALGLKTLTGYQWFRDSEVQTQAIMNILSGKAGASFNVELPATHGAVTLPDFTGKADGRYELVFTGTNDDGISRTGEVTSLFGGSGQAASTKTVDNRDSVILIVEDGAITSAAHIDRKSIEAAAEAKFGHIKSIKALIAWNSHSTSTDHAVSADVIRQLLATTEVNASKAPASAYLKKVRDLNLTGLDSTNALTDTSIDAMNLTTLADSMASVVSQLHAYFTTKVSGTLEQVWDILAPEKHALTAAYTVTPLAAPARKTVRKIYIDGGVDGQSVTYPTPTGTATETFYRAGWIQVFYAADTGAVTASEYYEGIQAALYDDTQLRALIQGNTDAAATNAENITSNSDDISANADSITDNATNITTNTGNVAANKVYLLGHSIEIIESRITEYVREAEFSLENASLIRKFGNGVKDVELTDAQVASGGVVLFPDLRVVRKNAASAVVRSGAIASITLEATEAYTPAVPCTGTLSFTQGRAKKVVQAPAKNGTYTITLTEHDTTGAILATEIITTSTVNVTADETGGHALSGAINTAMTAAGKELGFNGVYVNGTLSATFAVASSVTVTIA